MHNTIWHLTGMLHGPMSRAVTGFGVGSLMGVRRLVFGIQLPARTDTSRMSELANELQVEGWAISALVSMLGLGLRV